MISIVTYREEWKEDFRRLNLEWLDKYNLREDADMIVLNDPQKEVLDKGGFIFLAVADGKAVGSAALLNEGHGHYELAKMSVTESWQGKGISKLLLEKCLEKAKEVNATKLELFSNHQLKNALKLYEKYGFVYIDVKDSPFATADIKMELSL
jgi:putative acetyltransferase